MRTATDPKPNVVDQPRYRRELTLNIFRLLTSNGYNARPVYDMRVVSIPAGGIRELMRTHPFNAVRAEVGGTTLTVEVTTERHGEQNDPDALCYACYDFEDFRAWFLTVLQKTGMQLQPPADVPADVVTFFSSGPKAAPVRADLRPRPMFHRQTKRPR
ncbi:MAG: hypothetical protein JWP57_3705 [Spirosoma sp.]|nr:hypothetical protein [Spirosoma sp.]